MLELREREETHDRERPRDDHRPPARRGRRIRLRPRQDEDSPGERPEEARDEKAEGRDRHVVLDETAGVQEAEQMVVQEVKAEECR